MGWGVEGWHGSCFREALGRSVMSARNTSSEITSLPAVETTLLELVRAVSEITSDDREVVATVMEMLRSGRVRLCGSFRGSNLDAA
jgi:hypothetical protein